MGKIAKGVPTNLDDPKVAGVLGALVGTRLYAVTFATASIQLLFDNHVLTSESILSVVLGKTTIRESEPGYKDALCRFIGRQVSSYRLDSGRLMIEFGVAALQLSLKAEDCDGPEAGTLSKGDLSIVFRPDGIFIAEFR